jgi:hypothetical protein
MAFTDRSESLLVVRYSDGRIEYVTAKTAALEIASPDAIALRYQRSGRLPAGRITATIRAR